MLVKAYVQKRESESQDKIALAYVNALWTVQWMGGKKPQSLKQILKQMKPKKEMTPEQMLEAVKKLNAAFGGEVRENGK